MPSVAWFRSLVFVLLAGCGGAGVDGDGASLSHVQSEGTSGVCPAMTNADAATSADATTSDGCAAAVANPCWLAVPDGGFVDRPLATTAGAFTAAISIVPAVDGIDGVLGLAAGVPSTTDDLAVALRFNANHSIDARNGDSFSSVSPLNYAAGSAYRVLFVVDVVGHAYSAWVNGRLVAEDYAFHGAPGATLDRFTTTVTSETGAFRACGFGVSADERLQWLHHDLGQAAPRSLAGLASGALLITSSAGTALLDPLGNVAQTFADGAAGIALDGSEHRYLFGDTADEVAPDGAEDGVASSGSAHVSKYDATFTRLFTRTIERAADERLSGFDVNATGSFTVLVGSRLLRFDENGSLTWTQRVAGAPSAVALDAGGNTYVAENGAAPASFSVSKLDARGALLWTRAGAAQNGGAASVLALRATPDGVALAGSVAGTLELGGAPLRATRADHSETFVAWFDATGGYLDGTVVDLAANGGLGLDTAGTAIVGGTRDTPDTFLLERIAFDGRRVTGVTELGGHELTRGLFLGSAAAPVVDRAGNVYWALTARMLPQQSAPFLLKLRP